MEHWFPLHSLILNVYIEMERFTFDFDNRLEFKLNTFVSFVFEGVSKIEWKVTLLLIIIMSEEVLRGGGMTNPSPWPSF